jgi:hypothetical protein
MTSRRDHLPLLTIDWWQAYDWVGYVAYDVRRFILNGGRSGQPEIITIRRFRTCEEAETYLAHSGLLDPIICQRTYWRVVPLPQDWSI